MKQLCAKLLVIAALGMLLATAGCITSQSDLVVTDVISANIVEHETTGSFSTFTVVDDFKIQLEKALEKAGKKTADVKSIHMIGATFQAIAVTPKDARATADITIARQDVSDGPAAFVSFNNTLLKSLQGKPTDAVMNADGVALVDRALADLLEGGDPTLVLTVNNETITPTPTPAAPLDFTVRVSVKFQAVIAGGN
jgi:ABC-type Zn uptake system ZnuABC Zn-binding protein ZnuA